MLNEEEVLFDNSPKFSQVLSRCNALLIHAPLDEELLDIQSQLHAIISQLQCQSYRYAKMRQLRDGLIDNQCQSHFFSKHYIRLMHDLMWYT